ncbi:hypothetical protein CMV_013997 [Castanea mollissima]|uniref:Uncharacterized protein n=1 Tax=Castanea mollissima TaxID=60419 RepID=A0A8J4VLF0_9ROSI|nr:hypothetical protein CMV_013997 [Castanea mollissima]
MFLAKKLFLIAIWLSFPNLGYVASREVSKDAIPTPIACMNCPICQYPYQCNTPPPPLSGYPSPPPPPLSDYSPPPLPPPPAQGKCPPTQGVQCCQPPPPSTYQYPPPIYSYVPYNNFSASTRLPTPFFSIVISVFSFAVLP